VSEPVTFSVALDAYRRTVAASRRLVVFVLLPMILLFLVTAEQIRARHLEMYSLQEQRISLEATVDNQRDKIRDAADVARGEGEGTKRLEEVFGAHPPPFAPGAPVGRLPGNPEESAVDRSPWRLKDETYAAAAERFGKLLTILRETEKPFQRNEETMTSPDLMSALKNYLKAYGTFYEVNFKLFNLRKKIEDTQKEHQDTKEKFPTPLGDIKLSPGLALLVIAFLNIGVFISVQLQVYRMHAIFPLCGALSNGRAGEIWISDPPPFWAHPLPESWLQLTGRARSQDAWRTLGSMAFCLAWIVFLGLTAFEANFVDGAGNLNLIDANILTWILAAMIAIAIVIALNRFVNSGPLRRAFNPIWVYRIVAGRYTRAYARYQTMEPGRRHFIAGSAAASLFGISGLVIFDHEHKSPRFVARALRTSTSETETALLQEIQKYPYHIPFFNKLVRYYGREKRYDDIWSLLQDGRRELQSLAGEVLNLLGIW